MLINLKDIFENDFERIEREIRNSCLRSDLVIGYTSLMFNIESFDRMTTHMIALGVMFCDVAKPLFNLTPDNLQIKYMVPRKSELFYETQDGEVHYLCGDTLSKIIKRIIISAIKKFCIRSEICSLDTSKIKFMCKEVDTIYTDDKYNRASQLISEHEFAKEDENDSSSSLFNDDAMNEFLSRPANERELILKQYVEHIQPLAWYGITVTKDSMNAIMKNKDNQSDIANTEICFSVPKSSDFLHNGKEIAGENAFHFVMEAYSNVHFAIQMENARYEVRDEYWTREKFNDMYSANQEFLNIVRNM